MKRKKRWIWISLVVIIPLIGAGYYYRTNITRLVRGQQWAGLATNAQARGDRPDPGNLKTTTIRPATDSSKVGAAGNIEVAGQQSAVLLVDGLITEVTVEVGDEVAAGDLLVALDTVDLERAIQRAELELATGQAQLDKLLEPADPADIAAAQANLVSAKENLAAVQAGPGAVELAAMETALAAVQERYRELEAGKSEAELTQLGVEFHKASIALQQAQEAYDEIAFRGDIGSTQQAMTLQENTIDYDAAKAAYEIATEPPSQADLQEALKAIKEAEYQLESLRQQPTAADLAAAEAQVAGVEADLAQLLAGPSEVDLREAELELQQAQLDLEEAEGNLARAKLRAPIDGTVLTVIAEVGQEGASGMPVVTLADLTNLELTVNVAEVDIGKVRADQLAQVTIDAFPDRVFTGVVSRIAPASESEGGVVNYSVTIRLDNLDLDGVRPGMTAVATISDDTLKASWLVPTNALREREGRTMVMVVRDGQQTRVRVTPGTSQGEWTIVQSPDLQADDEVVGEVSSFLDEDGNSGGGPRGPFGPPRGGRGRP
jgi:HlyD family secretion protein